MANIIRHDPFTAHLSRGVFLHPAKTPELPTRIKIDVKRTIKATLSMRDPGRVEGRHSSVDRSQPGFATSDASPATSRSATRSTKPGPLRSTRAVCWKLTLPKNGATGAQKLTIQ